MAVGSTEAGSRDSVCVEVCVWDRMIRRLRADPDLGRHAIRGNLSDPGNKNRTHDPTASGLINPRS